KSGLIPEMSDDSRTGSHTSDRNQLPAPARPPVVNRPRSGLCWRHAEGSMRAYSVGSEPVAGYRLTRFLGQGGYGQVWVAVGPGSIDIALKVVPLERTHGLKEFRAIGLVKKLRHPNLIPIFAYWLKDEFGNVLEESDQDSAALRGRAAE